MSGGITRGGEVLVLDLLFGKIYLGGKLREVGGRGGGFLFSYEQATPFVEGKGRAED